MTAFPKVGILTTVINDSFVNTPRSQKGQMREDQKKGALRFSMQSLIGDRFLKRFFGSRLHRRGVNPARGAITLPAKETDKPDEPGYTTRGNPPDTDAILENEQTGEVNQLAVPENGSDQPTTDDYPLTADVCRS
jgi:hypothetical protein